MKKRKVVLLLLFHLCLSLLAQNSIKGTVLDSATELPIKGTSVEIVGTLFLTRTNNKGIFSLRNLPNGTYVIRIKKENYETIALQISLNGESLDLEFIYLERAKQIEQSLSVINLTDDELNYDEGFTDNIAGLLQSSRDIFFTAAAFDFSSTFFRPRGLDNSNGKVLINGVEMNKLFNGRPQWANWGGMNDLQRNQTFTPGISANEQTFGDLAGVNSIIMRASSYSEGGRISFASANRNYRGRIMANYSSGVLKNGWSYAFLASRRFGEEGFINGTLYSSNSFFVSVEKKWNDNHSLNANFIYAQNRRGRATAITNEVHKLKGSNYNPLWGMLNGTAKNSRERSIIEPIIMLNHYWKISEKTNLNTNFSFQSGFIGNTRIDNGGTDLIVTNEGHRYFSGGARNPNPTYYQNLPSFFLNQENLSAYDYQLAFLSQKEFENNGQLQWLDIFQTNQRQAALGNNAVFVLQEDRLDDSQLTINSILLSEINNHINLNAGLTYRNLKNESYARISNLLGGTGFLDVDFFAEETSTTENGEIIDDVTQSDVRNPDRIVKENERYKYNFEMDASVKEAFIQTQFNYSKIEFYLGANYNSTSYQRNGLYENGHFQGDQSFGKSKKLNFNNFGFKGGFTYKITGQHLLDFNAAYLEKAPTIRNSFENSRQNNNTIIGIDSEKIQTFDASYILRTPIIQARLTTYYTGFRDGTNISFFFTESGNTFTQEIMTNIERRNIGGELGIAASLTSTLKLKGVAAIGQFTFNNNPSLYYTSDDFGKNATTDSERVRTFGDGTAKMKNLRVPGGPQNAFQLGLEYRDPDYWWIGLTANHFSQTYVGVSALKRSGAFTTDFDLISDEKLMQGGNISGYLYNDFDPKVAHYLLEQERFDPYVLVNLVGGKSWRIGEYYIGVFASVNNLFNTVYRTGGFEQSRRIGYRDQIKEQNNTYGPVFGNRYFFGNGTTYFINFNIKF